MGAATNQAQVLTILTTASATLPACALSCLQTAVPATATPFLGITYFSYLCTHHDVALALIEGCIGSSCLPSQDSQIMMVFNILPDACMQLASLPAGPVNASLVTTNSISGAAPTTSVVNAIMIPPVSSVTIKTSGATTVYGVVAALAMMLAVAVV
ncbi:hypothetical protein HDU98_009288 [Podochytrium sp. JEL0797]|nr:hypothetical protein HDU98_009288 [Podochytrium sp. JEL0797]